jgi:hypothetical protein
MSYQAGGATSPVDLLAQFKVFLSAAGWTVDQDFAQGNGRVVSVHKGVKFITLRSFINEGGTQLGQNGGVIGSGIAIIAHTGAYVVPGVPAQWYNQAGSPILYNQAAVPLTCVMFTPPGIITNYWMFADAAGDNVVLVGFKASGVYTYLYFGDIIKVQAWTGSGVYFGASSPMVASVSDADGTTVMPPPPAAINSAKAVGLLKCTVDSFAGLWTSLTRSAAPGTITASGKGMQSTSHRVGGSDEVFDNIGFWGLRTSAASSRTGGLIMLPTLWLVERDFGGALTGGGWSLVGTIPYIYQTKSDGFVPGASFNIGTDPYTVFPGFAIRKFP